MKLKRIVNYTVDPVGKWAGISAALSGLAFFCLAVYYFTVRDLALCGVGEIVLCLILPLLATLLWILLIRILPLKQPVIYGILAAVICLVLIIQGFYSGSVLRIVLGFVWYLLAAAVMVFVSFGYLPYRVLIFAVCLLPAALRVFFAYVDFVLPENYWHGLRECFGVLMLLSLTCYAGMLKQE